MIIEVTAVHQSMTGDAVTTSLRSHAQTRSHEEVRKSSHDISASALPAITITSNNKLVKIRKSLIQGVGQEMEKQFLIDFEHFRAVCSAKVVATRGRSRRLTPRNSAQLGLGRYIWPHGAYSIMSVF